MPTNLCHSKLMYLWKKFDDTWAAAHTGLYLMSTAYLQLEIKLVKCNRATGRQQMHVNAHLDATDEIDEYLFLKNSCYMSEHLWSVYRLPWGIYWLIYWPWRVDCKRAPNQSLCNDRKRTNHSAVFSHMIAQHVEELLLNQSLCNKNEIAVCSTALCDQSQCSIQSHDSSACKRAATRTTATNCCICKAFTNLHILQVRM